MTLPEKNISVINHHLLSQAGGDADTKAGESRVYRSVMYFFYQVRKCMARTTKSRQPPGDRPQEMFFFQMQPYFSHLSYMQMIFFSYPHS